MTIPIISLMLATVPQPPAQAHLVIESPIPAYGEDTGSVTRVRSGRFDLDDETSDLLVLQGVEAEFLMNPSVPTPDWLTSLTGDAVNDMAVLPGAGPGGRDLALTIGATGLLSHAWDPASTSGFTTSTMRAGSWIGGTLLEVIDEGETCVIAALSAGGNKLLRTRIDGGQMTDLPPLAVPTGLQDIEGIDWDGTGGVEVALQIANLGFFVVDDLGGIVGSFPTLGVDERMTVSRSSVPGERDLLMAYAFDSNIQSYVLLGGCAEQYTNVVVSGDLGAYDMCAFDANEDGREDVVLLLREIEAAGEVLSEALVYSRSGAFALDPVVLERVSTADLGGESATDMSVAMDVADFDNDGDEDLAFVSAEGRALRIWHSDAIDEGAQIGRSQALQVTLYDGEGGAGPGSAVIDFNIEPPTAGALAGDIQQSNSVLIEVWRMNADLTAPVFESNVHVRQVLSHNFWATPAVSVAASLSIGAGITGELDDHAFRIDVTLVEATDGEVIRRFMTEPIWYASDGQVMSDVEAAVGEWPFRTGTDPENTTGPISGSGPPAGSGPPSSTGG